MKSGFTLRENNGSLLTSRRRYCFGILDGFSSFVILDPARMDEDAVVVEICLLAVIRSPFFGFRGHDLHVRFCQSLFVFPLLELHLPFSRSEEAIR